MLEDGARRPPSYYGLHCLALFAGDVSCYFLVGQGPPRPVLHDEKIYWGWRTWHGGHRPTMVSFFVITTPSVKIRQGI